MLIYYPQNAKHLLPSFHYNSETCRKMYMQSQATCMFQLLSIGFPLRRRKDKKKMDNLSLDG